MMLPACWPGAIRARGDARYTFRLLPRRLRGPHLVDDLIDQVQEAHLFPQDHEGEILYLICPAAERELVTIRFDRLRRHLLETARIHPDMLLRFVRYDGTLIATQKGFGDPF